MGDSTHFSIESGTAPYPPVKPPWLRPVVTAVVIAAHVFVAWITLVTSVQLFHAIDVTLVPSGEPLGSQEQEADEQPPPPEEVELPDLAMPAPLILSPDAPVKEEIIKPKTHVVKKRAAVERENAEPRAPGRRALGLPEGRAAARSRMDYAALLAIAIRRHTPTATSTGSGTARVQFHVNAYGAIIGISASGSNPVVAALARRIVSSVHAPPPPGGSFFGVQNFVFK
jgi:protein TonB